MLPLITAIAPALFDLVDDLFTTDEEKAKAKHKLIKMEQDGELEAMKGQLAVNLQEAKSESRFVSGWRPFVGWTCGASLAWEYLVKPFAVFVGVAFDELSKAQIDLIPTLEMSVMMPVLLGMLGLGGMRSFEKWKGTNKNR